MHATSLATALGAALVLALPQQAAAQACTFVPGPDLLIGDVSSVANYAALGDLEALALGHTICNVGAEEADYAHSTPHHPVFGGNLYRYKDMGGWFAFEQVGLSWLQHGFFALSHSFCCTNCTPTDGTHLGVGCSDPSTAARNGSQVGLGPRWQVDAHQGAFPFPPANPPFASGSSTARRIQVALADLEPTALTTTRYFGESHVIAADDAAAGNGDNNASYRRMAAASPDGIVWTFSFLESTQRERSAIHAWRDTDPAVSEVEITVPGEGARLVLAQRVTALGGGQWHYEYALYNMSSHEALRRFALPIPAGATLSNAGFHDVVYRDGDGQGSVSQSGADWTVTLGGGTIAWETDTFAADPNANALRWGTTYNFRFDADAPPAPGTLTLGRFRTPGDFEVGGVLVPNVLGTPFCDASDGSLAACPCANPGHPDTGCDNSQGTGGVRVDVLAQTLAPDAATLSGTGFSPAGSPAAIVIRSSALDPAQPVVFGDGLRCIAASPLVRLAATLAAAGTSTHALGHGAGPGTFHYQIWYRNVPSTFCDPFAAFNLSNGTSLDW